MGARPSHATEVQVQSVIDRHGWNEAGWKGVLYAGYGPEMSPVFGSAYSIMGINMHLFGMVSGYVPVGTPVMAQTPADVEFVMGSPFEEYGKGGPRLSVRAWPPLAEKTALELSADTPDQAECVVARWSPGPKSALAPKLGEALSD